MSMPKKLKIAIVFDDSLDRPDGVQQQIKLFGTWLASQGHRLNYLVGQTKIKTIAGQPVHSLSRNFRVSANQNTLSLPRRVAAERVTAILEREHFDVMYVMLPFGPLLGLTAVKAAQRAGIPLVGTWHTHPASPWQAAGSSLYGWFIRRWLQHFKATTSVSEPTRRYVRQRFGVDSLVLPNFIDIVKFRAGRPRAELRNSAATIMFFNRLNRRKGPQYLIAAAARLAARTDVKFNLVICGQGPLENQLRSQVATLELADRTRFTGFVPEADKADYLASADVVVQPATGGEAFGLVLLESMAAGAVTLGGNNPGFSSVLGGRPQLLFNPSDDVALADKLEQILINPAEKDAIIRWQTHQLAQYDIEVVGPRLLAILITATNKA
ncbi:MAG TPA: glycosyltransferase family 4 protein [Candidatus Saccharimonadales bacterium]